MRSHWRVSHLLGRWQGYMDLTDKLTEVDQKGATLLFNGLKALSDDEVSFLSDKYLKHIKRRVYSAIYAKEFSNVPGTDEAIADMYGLTMNNYRHKRLKILDKLQVEVDRLSEIVEEKQKERLPEFFLSHGPLYLKGYGVNKWGDLEADVIFTYKPEQARVFVKGDQEAERLQRSMKLDKCPVDMDAVVMLPTVREVDWEEVVSKMRGR